MLLRIGCAAALGWMLLAAPAAAEPAPIERAKQAYAEGVALHAAGKLTEAIEKFKLSYELSRNPLLLYDIGITLQQLGSNHLAVVYYRRFLAEAAADAAHRGDAGERIAALTSGVSGAPDTAASGIPAASGAPDTEPSGALDAGDAVGFAHRPIESAPPGQPLDLTAALTAAVTAAATAARPAGARWTVTLRFRNAGQAGFTATPMVPRGGELVGRIPAARMTGSAVQYYLEARDPERGVVARSGRSTAPHVVALDAAAPPRFFSDVAEPVLEAPAGDREDPLARRDAPVAVPAPRDGVLDVGSRRFGYAKWGSTAVAGTGIALGAVLYVLARDHATALADDATGCGAPPCQKFDAFDRDVERTGRLEQTLSNAALIGGITAAAVAGYFWYRELRWSIAPSVATGARGSFTGATAAVRF